MATAGAPGSSGGGPVAALTSRSGAGGRRFKWAIELGGGGGGPGRSRDRGSNQGDSNYPVGYLEKPPADISVQEADQDLVQKMQPYYYAVLKSATGFGFQNNLTTFGK
ncbi:ER membrane protein complex subunit 4-like [Protopterus annectens]|uniref:ER membrane protein complex subunit 4-like n=1 Tax=Protopterus annectens TaxID=7888 RepID=UPI001CFBA63B|nr:ER membrane protein complex subunit 4-like [Protopterus annectens]